MEKMARVNAVQVVVVTGPVGIGKSTVGAVLSELLSAQNVAHGFIDMDHMRWCEPKPQNDPFHVQLGMRNLEAVAAAYREAGAQVLVLADVVERVEQTHDYAAAIPEAAVIVVRLVASRDALERRIRERSGAERELTWELARSAELTELMDERGVGDMVVVTDGRTPADVATEIASRLSLLS